MIPAIVLAAGRSLRFGRPKALLDAGGGATFVRRVLTALQDGGAAEAVVVVRPDDPELVEEVSRAAPFASAVVNPQADVGQLSSLIAGLDSVERPGVVGAVVTLVDVPLISPRTVRLLLDAARSTGAPIVRAAFGGKHGHPVFFARALFDELRRANPASGGAKDVVRRHEAQVVDVDVADPGVIEDVDTPADYERLFPRPR